MNHPSRARRNFLFVLGLVVALTVAGAAPGWSQSSSDRKPVPVQDKKNTASSSKKSTAQSGDSSGQTQPEMKQDDIPRTVQSLAKAKNATADPGIPPKPNGSGTTIRQPADFRECVRVALMQSPMLVRTALEIESKRLDVQDAWSTFIPTLSVNMTYWFSQPEPTSGDKPRPYTISFGTGAWNPIISGFDVKAKQELTNIAVLSHLKVIAEGIRRLATDFLQLSMMADQRDIIRQKQELAKLNLEFFKTRLGMGQATQLDVRIAETKLQLLKSEEDKLNSTRTMVQDDVKFILGVPFINKLDLDLKGAREQILGKFGPADVTEDKIRGYSFELRMMEYERRLQQKNIALSYVRLLPTFGFTFQTVDGLSNTSTQSSNKGFQFYPGATLSLPLDFWTKGRDISRNYKKLDQQLASGRAKEFELMVSAHKAMAEYQGANSDYSMSQSTSELNRLQDEQTEYRHKTGQVDFDKFITDRNAYYETKQKLLLSQLQREMSLLNLKHLTGDLQNQYIDVASWEK